MAFIYDSLYTEGNLKLSSKKTMQLLNIEHETKQALVMRKSGLIRKIRLTSKFMTSQHGLQTIAIHILPNISLSKGNHEVGRLVPDLFSFFERA